MAALSIANKDIGALVPMHSFYRAVDGFLDPAVKRTIDQANENVTLDQFDVQTLRTLFMIRYVDLIKGTLDNLVTLSIEQVDEDKLALRHRIEATLQRLEKESLITRNGDEFIFLTNEERDITRQIKATEIAASDENKELANLIFKDLLKDKNKYRYQINKTDYIIGRFVDGHTHVDEKLAQLQAEIDKSGIATPELCNRLLRPLQLIKTDIAAEASIATILMLQSQTADERLHEAVDELESAIQSEAERVKRLLQVREGEPGSSGDGKPAPSPVVKPAPPLKPVVEVAATSVFNKLGKGIYLESLSDIDSFITALRAELESAVKQDKRIKIK